MNRASRVGLHRLTVGSALGIAAALLLVATVGAGGARPQGLPTIVVTETGDDGPGSLRQAIREAPPGAVIQMAPKLAQKTIVLVTGELVISHSLTIDASQASGVVITADRRSRVLRVESGAEVHLIGLTLTGGRAPENVGPPGNFGGGIQNFGTLILINGVVTGNRAGDGIAYRCEPTSIFPAGNGGGIYNQGRLTVVNSVISHNQAGNARNDRCTCPPPEAMPRLKGGSGGGIYNVQVLEIINSRIVENRAGNGAPCYCTGCSYCCTSGAGGDGGGLFNEGTASIVGSTIARNAAGNPAPRSYSSIAEKGPGWDGSRGGGIFNAGQLALESSTVNGNTAGKAGDGGGLYNSSTGEVSAVNCVVTNNQAGPGLVGRLECRYGCCRTPGGPGGDGGGILNAGTMRLQFCTIFNNQPGVGGPPLAVDYPGCTTSLYGLDGRGGGLFGSFTLLSSIIAGNRGGDCAGNVLAGGRNLIQDPEGCTVDPSAYDNIIGRNPLLGLLRIEAPGHTPTRPLLPGSPAIDAAPCAPDVPTDQRGVPRPQGAGCDIGAYEYEPQRWRLIWLPR